MTALKLDLPAGVTFVPGTDGSRSSIGRSYKTLLCHVNRRQGDTVERTLERARDALSIAVATYLVEDTVIDHPCVVEWRVEPNAYVSEDQERVTARCRLGVVKWQARELRPVSEGVVEWAGWEIGAEDNNHAEALK